MNELAKPLTNAVSAEATELLEQSIQGQEQAYRALLKIALSATTSKDWTNFKDSNGEDRPDLARSGAAKIALRLGASIKIDRTRDNEPLIQREEFEDDLGKGYVYTTIGRIEFSNGRVVEEIGTASTRDQFLGMENKKDEKGNYVKGADGKAEKVPVVLHESMQDAKKKSVANLFKRAITSGIGLGGLGWADLEPYGIFPAGKTSANFKTSKEKPTQLPEKTKGHPFWASEFKGYQYFNVKVGKHFSSDWCLRAGLKESKTAGTYFGKYSESLWQDAEKQFAEAEAGEPGSEV